MADPKNLTSLELNPLKVKCTDTDCRKDLHCFKATAQMKKVSTAGVCRECGADLVDWKRVHKKDCNDVQYTLNALRKELIRHHFWHVEIDARAVNYARRKGLANLKTAVRSRIRSSISTPNNPYDGRQTPMEGSGNPIHYAQHATACCCRKCVEYWHDIPQTRPLTTDEIEYLSELAILFLEERIPNLKEEGERIPSIAKES